MNAEEFKTIAIGDTITYTLSSDQRPRNPQREYRGIVNRINPDVQMVIVTLLDEGYEGTMRQLSRDRNAKRTL